MFFIGVYMQKVIRKGTAIVSTDNEAYMLAKMRRNNQRTLEQRITTLENQLSSILDFLNKNGLKHKP